MALYRAVLAALLIAVYLLLPGQKAAILSYIDPLVAVLISVTILGETMTLWQVVGGVLILGFTLWNEISPKEKIKSVFSKALNINCFAEYALFYFFFLLLIR